MSPILLVAALGQLWSWTAPAPHHAAAVIVTCESGESGSGVLADLGGLRGVLTAAHVVEGRERGVLVRWQDGHEAKGDATRDKTGADFAWVPVDRDGAVALEIGPTPAVGDAVEFLGFGHPQRKFRHWSAKRVQTGWDSVCDYSGHVVPGDSGGPILNAKRQVVGVITGGNEQVGSVGELPIYRGGVSDTTEELVDFAERVKVKYCVVPCEQAKPSEPERLPTPENPPVRSPDETLRAALEDGERPVVVLLGLEGCEPCKRTAKSLEPLTRRKGVAYFYSPDSASFGRDKVAAGESFPQVLVYRRVAGVWVAKRHIGARTLEQVEDMLGGAAELAKEAMVRLRELPEPGVATVDPPTRDAYIEHVTDDHGVRASWASTLQVDDLVLVHSHAHDETLPEEWYADGGKRNADRVNAGGQVQRRRGWFGRRR